MIYNASAAPCLVHGSGSKGHPNGARRWAGGRPPEVPPGDALVLTRHGKGWVHHALFDAFMQKLAHLYVLDD